MQVKDNRRSLSLEKEDFGLQKTKLFVDQRKVQKINKLGGNYYS